MRADPSPSLRIALVSGGVPMGGATTFLVNFAGELIQRGVPVKVFSFEKENPLSADFQKQNIDLLCLDQKRMIFEDRLQTIMRALSRFQPTVVVTTLGAVSFEVLRYLPGGVLRIGMGQSDDPLVYAMMGHYAAWMDLVVMVSQAMKQRAEAMPEFGRVPVVCLPYGVPMCPAGEIPARAPDAPLRILYFGRLGREQKRVHLFPEILQQLVDSRLPFQWTIAGEGEERGFLEANMKPTLPGQVVTFAGTVPYAQVPALLNQHDIYLLASNYEGLPLSLLEAMGHGLVPVVSNLTSGIPEVVDQTNGLLVPVEQVAGYAQAILHLHHHRDELRLKSAAARNRVEKNFSVAAMTDRWLATLPASGQAIVSWPDHWRVQAPRTATNGFYYSKPVRALRRIAALVKK